VGARDSSFLHNVHAGCKAHPASCTMGTRGSFLGVEAGDHSSPSVAEAKNGGAISPVPHTSSRRGAQLIKTRDNFTFTNRFKGNFTAVAQVVFEGGGERV
jgi:hypothetical protein